MRAILMAVLLATGCGPDGSSPGLEGEWALEHPDGCVEWMGLDPDGTFEIDVACLLQGGDIGVEATVGKWDDYGDSIGFTAEGGTCPPPEPLYREIAYDLEGDRLRLVGPSGALVYQRHQDDGDSGGSSGRIVFGCWNGDSLEFMPIRSY